MYRQKLKVAFHEMDQSAKELADTITDLTKHVDPHNLVILCGENHVIAAHQFYQSRLMYHLLEHDMIGIYCQELSIEAQAKIKRACKATTLAEKTGYSVNACTVLSCARTWGIPSYLIYMPRHNVAKYDSAYDYVHAFPNKMLRSPRVELLQQTGRIKQTFNTRKKLLHVASNRAQIQRDVYMMEQIHTISHGDRHGVIMVSNGYDHVHQKKDVAMSSTTLTSMLLATGKDIVTVGLRASKNNPKRYSVTQGLSRAEKRHYHAAIDVVLPDDAYKGDAYWSFKKCIEKWRKMEAANGLGQMSM